MSAAIFWRCRVETDRINDSRSSESAAASRWGVTGASCLFSVAIFLLITLGYRAQARNFYSGILITEFILILLPALLYALTAKASAKESLRLNKPKTVNFPIVFGIMIFAVPLAAVFNLINLLLVDSVFGRIAIESIPAAQNGAGLLVNLLAIAVSAGICEEFLFRGVIQGTFERFGTAKSIILAAFLFSITHLDFQKILGTFVLGALIGYIVYRTNSLYCGMFAHFTNNAIAVIAGYVSNKMAQLMGSSEEAISQISDITVIFDIFKGMEPQQLVFLLLVYGFILIFVAIIFTLLLYLLARVNPQPHKARFLQAGNETEAGTAEAGKMTAASGKKGLLWLLPGLALVALWLFVQTCSFLGIQNTITAVFRQLIGA